MSLLRNAAFLAFLLLAPFIVTGQTTVKPDWVVNFDNGEIGKIADSQFYFGVSSSTSSQDQASSRARLEFASMVETVVTSTFQESATVTDAKEEHTLEFTSAVKTNLSLKGISITEKWHDPATGTYYSLIRLHRDEYVEILNRNIEEEIALQRVRFEQEREKERLAREAELAKIEAARDEQRIEAEKEQAKIEQERLELEEKRRKEQLKQLRRRTLMEKHADFLATQPQAALLSFRNAQLSARVQHYALTVGISPGITPFAADELLTRLHLGYSLFKFLDISTTTFFKDQDNNFDWGYQEIDAKLRLMNSAGHVILMSLGVGAKIILYEPLNIFRSGSSVGIGTTLYGAALLSVPMLLNTHISLYVGIDKVALGITTHPLFGWIGDGFGIILEGTFLIDDRLVYDGYVGNFLFQAGMRFKADHFGGTFAIEGHRKLTFTADLYF